MALIATALRTAFLDASRPLQYALLLFVAALFALVGGHFVGGLAVLSYEPDVGTVVTALLTVLLFSYIFVWYASELSESLSHRTYLSKEEFLLRGLRVFIIWVLVYLAVFLFYTGLPYPVNGLLAFFVALTAVYASVVVAVDGYTVFGAFVESFAVVRSRFFHVAEFVALSVFLLLPAFLIGAVGGFPGTVLSLVLITVVVMPWLSAHAVLTYLYKYPFVVAALNKLEGL